MIKESHRSGDKVAFDNISGGIAIEMVPANPKEDFEAHCILSCFGSIGGNPYKLVAKGKDLSVLTRQIQNDLLNAANKLDAEVKSIMNKYGFK